MGTTSLVSKQGKETAINAGQQTHETDLVSSGPVEMDAGFVMKYLATIAVMYLLVRLHDFGGQ